MKRLLATIVVAGIAVVTPGVAGASPSPNGPGQPGAPGTTCGSTGATAMPGNSASAHGSPFNPTGVAGTVYAGNLGTASMLHSNSSHAVAQYDVACFQVTQH
jgi:hypothetical protein